MTHAAAVQDTHSLMETASLSPVGKIKSTPTKNRSVYAISDTISLAEFVIDALRAKFTTAKLKLVRIQLPQSADSTSIGTNAAVSASSVTSEFREFV